MSDYPVFWEREMYDERERANRLEREVLSLRSALDLIQAGDHLVDLIHRLATEVELREFHFDDEHETKPYCFSCEVERTRGTYGWKLTHATDCPLSVALGEAEKLGWERD